MTNNNNLSFGKRYGYEPVDVPFQYDDMDESLRMELWNIFYLIMIKFDSFDFSTVKEFTWPFFFKEPIDEMPDEYYFKDYVKDFILQGVWYRVYEFFEYLFAFDGLEDKQLVDIFEYNVNRGLKTHNSGYFLHEGKFIRLIEDEEIEEIQKVGANAEKYGLAGIRGHLDSALEFISMKPEPDFRNSIKESISMVEVISRTIESDANTLGKALTRLGRNQRINSTLRSGFEKLYGYTNGKNGIRHANLDEKDEVDYEEARFFLVSCSAFTNYLIEKARKGDLLNDA